MRPCVEKRIWPIYFVVVVKWVKETWLRRNLNWCTGCIYQVSSSYLETCRQVSFKKEVGVRVNYLIFWLTLWLKFENLWSPFKWHVFMSQKCSMLTKWVATSSTNESVHQCPYIGQWGSPGFQNTWQSLGSLCSMSNITTLTYHKPQTMILANICRKFYGIFWR